MVGLSEGNALGTPVVADITESVQQDERSCREISPEHAIYQSLSSLVQTLSCRFMSAEPSEEAELLDWTCEELGTTLHASVVAVRDLNLATNMTELTACWAPHASILRSLDTPLGLRGATLPTTTIVAQRPEQMPVLAPEESFNNWGRAVGAQGGQHWSLFSPLLDGSRSTGFVCVVFTNSDEVPPEVVAMVTSISAVISQFRQRVAMERTLRSQMELSEIQEGLAEAFATARVATGRSVLADALQTVGEHLRAESVALWKLDGDGTSLTRRMRWQSSGEGPNDGQPGLTFRLSDGLRDLIETPWPGVASFDARSIERRLEREIKATLPSGVRFWCVPIMGDEQLCGCMILGLPKSRHLEEWETVGLRSIASMVPVVQSRLAVEEQLISAVQSSPTGIVLRTSAGNIIDCNQAYCDFVGEPDKAALIGTNRNQGLAPSLDVDDGVEIRMNRPDGTVVWGRLYSAELPGQNATVIQHVEDVTAEVLERQALTRRANFDALTGLPNRHGFADILAEAGRSRPVEESEADHALLMIDVNGFKAINDTHGHLIGDAVLREVSERIQRSVRSSDRAVRYGGDEFIVLLAGPLSGENAHRVAANIHEPMNAPVHVGTLTLDVTLSVGVAMVKGELETEFVDALHRADVAMYRSKDRGRGLTTL